ncbi:conserved hypothetical protein [Gammaproteobacteria bacterium]
MAKYLAKFSSMVNEIEISGFVVMNEREVENFEELALSITWDFVYEFGEDDQFQIEFSDGEDLLSRIEFKEINLDEAKIIKRLFNNEFGTFIGEAFLEEVIGEEDSDFDEDDDDDDDINYEINY